MENKYYMYHVKSEIGPMRSGDKIYIFDCKSTILSEVVKSMMGKGVELIREHGELYEYRLIKEV